MCTARALGMRAESPLPSTLRCLSGLFTGEDLLCELDIAFSAARTDVIRNDGLSETRGFGEAYASGDYCREDLIGEEFPEVLGDLTGEVHALVVHRKEDSFDGQIMAKRSVDAFHRVQELRDPFQGEELALNRDEHRIGGYESVESQEVESGGAVYQNEMVGCAEVGYAQAKLSLASVGIYEFNIGGYEILVRWDDAQALEIGWLHRILNRGMPHKDVICCWLAGDFGDPQAGGGVTLRIGVDEKDLEIVGGERSSEVDGRGGLTDATLLVGYRDYFSQMWGSKLGA